MLGEFLLRAYCVEPEVPLTPGCSALLYPKLPWLKARGRTPTRCRKHFKSGGSDAVFGKEGNREE
jgi:hypothetical protein